MSRLSDRLADKDKTALESLPDYELKREIENRKKTLARYKSKNDFGYMARTAELERALNVQKDRA